MSRAVYAAGAVCWRVVDGDVRVLLIHRSRHNDVSLPKGKVDPGETLPQTAVREIREETGLEIALGVPLGVTRYELPSGMDKVVHYWAAEVTEESVIASDFLPNGEVAALEWAPLDEVRDKLSYEHDNDIVDRFAELVAQGVESTFAIIVLRHGKAVSPSDWGDEDASRPLTSRGVAQSEETARSISAWAPKRIVTSSAKRCRSTVKPLVRLLEAQHRDVKKTVSDDISQDAYERGDAKVRDVVGKRVRKRKTTVLCSHGPVIPEIIREVALATGTPLGSYVQASADLETGGFSVIHLSYDRPSSGIIAVETHEPRV